MQNHKGTYLWTNIQPHPSTTAHNAGWFWISSFRFQRGVLVILVVLHVLLCLFYQIKEEEEEEEEKEEKRPQVQHLRMIFFPCLRVTPSGGHVTIDASATMQQT